MKMPNLMEKFFSQIEVHLKSEESSFSKWRKSGYENGKFYFSLDFDDEKSA